MCARNCCPPALECSAGVFEPVRLINYDLPYIGGRPTVEHITTFSDSKVTRFLYDPLVSSTKAWPADWYRLNNAFLGVIKRTHIGGDNG